jgi:hypothetical protein
MSTPSTTHSAHVRPATGPTRADRSSSSPARTAPLRRWSVAELIARAFSQRAAGLSH